MSRSLRTILGGARRAALGAPPNHEGEAAMPFQEHRLTARGRPSTPITVVLVDDEALIRQALSHALGTAGLQIVGEAESASDAVELVTDLRPDIVLMDINLKA